MSSKAHRSLGEFFPFNNCKPKIILEKYWVLHDLKYLKTVKKVYKKEKLIPENLMKSEKLSIFSR